MFGCQQVLIKTSKDTKAIIEYLCHESNDLYNCTVYYARQIWFKTGKKEGRPQAFWSKTLANVTEKRNRPMRDATNKAARLVINHCLENKIGIVVFGWNKGQKQGIDMGKKNNQKFVQVPTAKLKDRIAQLGQQYGIKFIETEESYTSKASFLDGDVLPKYDEKLDGWHQSGKRINRGLYRTSRNWLINADCNGAANCLKKVKAMLELDLSRVTRGILTMPIRRRLWSNSVLESPSL